MKTTNKQRSENKKRLSTITRPSKAAGDDLSFPAVWFKRQLGHFAPDAVIGTMALVLLLLIIFVFPHHPHH
jgi:hypothetical protein